MNEVMVEIEEAKEKLNILDFHVQANLA